MRQTLTIPELKIPDAALSAILEPLQSQGLGSIIRYDSSRYIGKENRWERLSIVPNGETLIAYGSFRELKPGDTVEWTDLYLPKFFTYSDYSGSSVERANTDEFLSLFGSVPGVYELFEDYGTRSIAVRLDALSEDMVELFLGLGDYPSLNDESLAQLEANMEEDDFSSWIWLDIRRALSERLRLESDTMDQERSGRLYYLLDNDNFSDESRWNLYLSVCARENIYWYAERAVSGYVDTDRIARAINWDELEALTLCS